MQDTQNFLDNRKVKIAKVGIKDVKYPIFYKDTSEKNNFPSVANFSFYVELPAEKKGTHMSRFPTLLYEFAPHFSLNKFEKMTENMLNTLETSKAYLEVDFIYFYEKEAPVSKLKGVTDICVNIQTEAQLNQKTKTKLSLQIPIKSLCPCSKAISEYGAHSQRSHLTISIWNPTLSILECIDIADNSASSAIYPILKRADEKYVTEKAYNNPRFVEDLVREAALLLKNKCPHSRFEVSSENFESIHNHNAYAFICSDDLS
ncbi:GTP cyclohydrolase FolE2 [Fluviispira multicolorata]|uniref:GTP cyclohydrolase FolE2 n=1 Tax=Fluviispira multicolorata TaxID=2654512 RepID=A0A833JDP8_9BACT|nr:GTP cyclohydrolase FolE2 [Fluviispira multicolorata]KAB8031978.1 GTP cyclohydrolase I FolE2 [Fluviispira multicolorata]